MILPVLQRVAILLASLVVSCVIVFGFMAVLPGDPDPEAEPASWSPTAPAVPTNGVVTPETFGAVGDGVADDSVALQRALDRAAATGAKVKLSEGRTYLSRRAIDLPSNSFVFGAGSGAVLKFTWTLNDAEHDGYYLGNKDQLTGNDDLVLNNFSIVGAGNGLPAGLNETHPEPRVPAIRLRLVDRFRLTNLQISYAPGISLIYQGVSNGVVRDNYIHHSGRDGINSTWHERNLHDIVVEQNTISRVGDDAIAVIGAPGQTPNTSELPYNIAIRDNEVLGWPSDPNGLALGRGIVVLAGTEVEISNNTINRTDSHGVLIARSTRSFSYDPATNEPWRSADIDLFENEIIDAGQNGGGGSGITIKASDRINLRSNVVTNPANKAMEIYDCEGCVIN